jgi:hypothetical protein
VTDYARATLTYEVSTQTDYGSPYVAPPKWVEALTPDESIYHARLEAALSPGTAINTSVLGTCTLLAVRNLDATNYVTLTWRSAGNGGTDNIVRIQPGDLFHVQDVTAATNPTLVANTAACSCEVLVLGT